MIDYTTFIGLDSLVDNGGPWENVFGIKIILHNHIWWLV